ncbi:MAG: glucose-6-phosphate isomerase [Thermoguttaceae bacterium]|jgi:glucose-6-phosphate isomerase
MTSPAIEPIVYDYSTLIVPDGAEEFVRQTGISRADVAWLAPRLAAARQEVLDDLALFNAKGQAPPEKQPLDAAFCDLPERLLEEPKGTVPLKGTVPFSSDENRDSPRDENRDSPRERLLDDIIASADRLAAEVDRVVVLGIGGSYMGARALMEALCHPYHNELGREARRGRPRLYFEGNNVDNDAVAGLLDLLRCEPDWAIIVISKSGGTLETAVGLRLFLEALRTACGGDEEKFRRRVVPVTGRSGRLRDLAGALGCPKVFPIHDGVGGRFSVLDPVGLLPAAVLGLDVVRLLQGAALMNERFRHAEPGRNPVLDYAGVSWWMALRRGAAVRVLSTWGKRLEAVGLWYDQLLAESLGKDGQGATPLTVVNTRDLHSRGQQHQEGRRDKLITNLVVERPERPPISVPKSARDQDRLNELAGTTLPEILAAARKGANQAYADDHRRTAALRLPRLDEGALGQLLQMFMLATAVEGRLSGINPYGQPGVEAYKKNMNRILREKGTIPCT